MKCLRCKSTMTFEDTGVISNNRILNFSCILVRIYVCDKCGFIELNSQNEKETEVEDGN